VEKIGIADDNSDADGTAILTWKQAQDAARALMVQAATVQADNDSLTVRDAVENYIAWLEDNRKTAVDARYRADALILPALGDCLVSELTTDQLRTWLSNLAKTPARRRTKPGQEQRYGAVATDEESVRRRRSSANRTLTVLKAALNQVWRDEKVTSDSAWRRVEPFEDVDAARVAYMSMAEVTRFLNAADAAFRPLARAALETGARYSELCRLRVEDFNVDSGTVAVRRTKRGKPRHVELSDDGVAFFEQHCAGREPAAPMFTKADGTPWGKSDQSRPMAGAVANSRIERVTFHGLRHTWASHATMNGVPLLVVAKNLGHADTRMVEKHYGHLAPSYTREAIRRSAPRFGAVDSNVALFKSLPNN
jgi:integrase